MKNHRIRRESKNEMHTHIASFIIWDFIMISHLLCCAKIFFSSSSSSFNQQYDLGNFFLSVGIFCRLLIHRLISWPFSSLLLLPSMRLTSRFTCVSVEINFKARFGAVCMWYVVVKMEILEQQQHRWQQQKRQYHHHRQQKRCLSFRVWLMTMLGSMFCTVHWNMHIENLNSFDLYTQFPCLEVRQSKWTEKIASKPTCLNLRLRSRIDNVGKSIENDSQRREEHRSLNHNARIHCFFSFLRVVDVVYQAIFIFLYFLSLSQNLKINRI